MITKNILKNNTRSICPECFDELDAKVVEENGNVFMIKECKKHGKFKVMIEQDAFLYKNLMNKNINRRVPYSNIMIPITHSCNLNCKICFYPKRKGDEISLKEYERIISDFGGNRVRLSGGEPTMRKDLIDIIRVSIKNKKEPLLTTNGLILSNINFVKRIKKAGIKKLCFSFNGFKESTDLGINNRTIAELKLKALKNLKKEGIHVSLSTLIHRGTNEDELEKIFCFVLEHQPFIHEWRVRTSNIVGRHTDTQPLFLSEIFDKVTRVISKRLPLDKERIMRCFIRNKYKIDHGPCRMYIDMYKRGKIFDTVMYKQIYPHLRISLRAWPNKYNVDLEEMKRCQSAFLIKDRRKLPLCYSLIMSEKKLDI